MLNLKFAPLETSSPAAARAMEARVQTLPYYTAEAQLKVNPSFIRDVSWLLETGLHLPVLILLHFLSHRYASLSFFAIESTSSFCTMSISDTLVVVCDSTIGSENMNSPLYFIYTFCCVLDFI